MTNVYDENDGNDFLFLSLYWAFWVVALWVREIVEVLALDKAESVSTKNMKKSKDCVIILNGCRYRCRLSGLSGQRPCSQQSLPNPNKKIKSLLYTHSDP